MSAKSRYSAIPKRKRHLPAIAFNRLTIGLFLTGFLSGWICANLFQAYLYEPVFALFQNTVNNLSSLNIQSKNLFFYCWKEYLKLFFLLLFFALTNVWRIYYTAFTLYTGFKQGLLLAFCLLLGGAGGILQYLCFLLPQTLLLIPVFLTLLNQLELLHSSLFATKQSENTSGFFKNAQKRQLLFSKLPFLLLCILFLTACSFLESYLNLPLLQYYHSKI